MNQFVSIGRWRPVTRVLCFVVFLYATWIGAWLILPVFEKRVGWLATSGGLFGYWLVMKILLWILPSVILLRASGKTLKEILSTDRIRTTIMWGVGIGLVLGIIPMTTKYLGKLPLLPSGMSWGLVSAVLISPIVEEITFRGAILQTLMKEYSFGIVNILTALFFLGSHIPGWYFQHKLLTNLTNVTGGALSILFLGWVFGMVYYKSKSVSGGILTHVLNNFFNA